MPCSYRSAVIAIVDPSVVKDNGVPSARGAFGSGSGFAAVLSPAALVVPGFEVGFALSVADREAARREGGCAQPVQN
uniref:Uncharacterized protein n=1 Tax=Streptomyces sp. NBC_01393 TaxID=2903851 RepID=A0AAU3HRG1_9ACTN